MDKKKYPVDFTEEEKLLKYALDELYKNDKRVPEKPLDLSFMQEEE